MHGVTSSSVFDAIASFLGLLGAISRSATKNPQDRVLVAFFGGATVAGWPQVEAECNNSFRLEKCAQSMDY